MRVKVKMPKLGLTMTEATIVEWRKAVGDAVKGADLVMILLPDENIGQVYREDIEPNIKKGAALAFAHGFNIH